MAFHARGIAYILKGRPDLAIADFTEAVRLNPRNVMFYSSRDYI